MRSAPAALALSLSILVGLTACNSAPTATAVPTNSGQTATALPTEAADTPAPDLSPSATASTGAATATAVPTETPQPGTPTPTATTAPTETPALTIVFVDNADCSDINRGPLPTTSVTVQQAELSVSVIAEIAATTSEQSQGLMCREVVQEGSGMLFVFESDTSGGFWMFNTYAPLDIIYFGGLNDDVSIRQMSPCQRGVGEEDTAWRSRCAAESGEYRPGIFYRHALELPQGWLEARGFDLSQPSDITVSID